MSVVSRPVVLLPSLPVGINVNHDSAEVRQVVEELVADLLRDLVTISHRQPPGTLMLTSAWRRSTRKAMCACSSST
jgi:hypothetical protein